MRQTLVSGDVRAKEIAALVAELKRRQLHLEGKFSARCPDSCADCAPCRKGNKGYSEAKCEALRREIISGNLYRWRKWAEYEQLLGEFERASREFSRRYELSPLTGLIDVAAQAFRALRSKRQPQHWRDAAESAFHHLYKLFNYNGEMAREFEKELGGTQGRLSNALERAKRADEDFEKQVREFRQQECTLVLMPEYFNRP